MSDDVLAIRFLSEASTNWLCQQTVLMIHWSWQSDLTLVRSTDWALFWSVVIFRMICQSRDQWLVTADGEKCKCPPAGMVIHHWFMLVKNCQIDHVAEVVMCCFVLFAVLMAVMWIMFPEGQPTKIAECCQLSLDSDRLRLEHNLPAVFGICYTGCTSITSVPGQVDVSCPSTASDSASVLLNVLSLSHVWLHTLWIKSIDSSCLFLFILISVIYSQLDDIKFVLDSCFIVFVLLVCTPVSVRTCAVQWTGLELSSLHQVIECGVSWFIDCLLQLFRFHLFMFLSGMVYCVGLGD